MLRTLLLAMALLIPPGATAIASKLLHFPKRFAVVEPAKLYRGGYPSPWNLRNLKDEHEIRTIVSLTGKVDKPHELEMLATKKELGLQHRRIPLPGNGCGEFADLDRAADALSVEEDQPIFFHCQAGKQRSNAVLAAYRMKHCGWTLKKALSELETHHGLEQDGREKVLVDHLTEYAKWLKVAE
ncbi:MAG: hypothetical protein MI923_23105 [Phycisphaerales bacterium]|nr:hypothetical protein [Phycisphaerales bacterium]